MGHVLHVLRVTSKPASSNGFGRKPSVEGTTLAAASTLAVILQLSSGTAM